MGKTAFRSEVENLIELKRQNRPDDEIKKEYLRLIKKYHPDLNQNENEYFAQCTLTLNHVFSEIRKVNTFGNKKTVNDEYGKYLTKKGYEFANHQNQIVRESNKEIFLFKLGFHKLKEARDYLGQHSAADGYGNEIIFTTSEMIFEGVKYLRDCVKICKEEMWKNEALEQIKYAYEMNNRITKQVINNGNKEIVIIGES